MASYDKIAARGNSSPVPCGEGVRRQIQDTLSRVDHLIDDIAKLHRIQAPPRSGAPGPSWQNPVGATHPE
ncbi:MAG: hypothetical protein ABT940_04070 [Alphaproteobacteria bacterium]